jgi:hypothetical protein
MTRAGRLLWILPPLVALIPFARLIAEPSALIVDGHRPSVDRALPEDARAVGNDLTRLFLPHHARVAAGLARTGRIPGWDPAGFGGRPLVGNPQAGLWYPPVWIAWRWWTPSALGWLTVAHLMFGGLGVYMLCRSSSMRRFASAVAGGIWCTSPYVLAQAYEGHYPHVWAASFAPWAFWAACGWWKGQARGWLLAPILAVSLLTGHAQEVYYLGLAFAAWLVAECLRSSLIRGPDGREHWSSTTSGTRANARPRLYGLSRIWCHWSYSTSALRQRRSLLRKTPGTRYRLASLAILATLTLGLVAIEMIPDLSARPFVSRRLPPTASDAGKYHIGLANLVQLASPFALGGPSDYNGPQNYWESLLSIGWTPLVLAAWAVAKSHRRRLVRGWLALVVVSTLFAFGRGFGVFDVAFAVIPGMGLFRVPSRALFLATLAVSMLAGLGVEAIASRPRGGMRPLLGYALATVAIVAVGAAAGSLGRVAADPRFLLAYLGCGVGMIALAIQPRHRRSIAIGLGMLALTETALCGLALIRTAPPEQFLGPDPVGAALAKHRPTTPFRIRARDAFYGDARAFAIGLEKTNLNDSFQIGFAADLYERLYPMFGVPTPSRFPLRFRPDLQADLLDRMNVRFLISDRDDDRFGWPLVESGEWDNAKFTIRENPEPLPRAYVVPRAAVLADGPGVPDHFLEYPPREFAILTQDVPLSADRQPFTPAEYVSSDPDHVEVRVTTSKPGFLVIADTWMPGWSARLDSAPVAILRGNRCQRVVVLPTAGTHRIVMTYTPPGLMVGRAITIAGILGWLGMMMWNADGRGRSYPQITQMNAD